jgi:nickel transport protein
MRYKELVILFSIIAFLPPSALYAHGVTGKVGAGGVVITAVYDTGEPMSYAKVKISVPGADVIFQSGRTDRNGRFCFFPDTPGDWKVVVDDEIGHRLEMTVPASEPLELKSQQQSSGPMKSSISRYERALVGISIIFGISGILFWLRGKRMSRTGKDTQR